MVGPLSSGLVDQQQVFLLPGQNVIFDIRQSPAFRKYSICWAFKHSVVVFVFVFTLTVGIMCQRTVQPIYINRVFKLYTLIHYPGKFFVFVFVLVCVCIFAIDIVMVGLCAISCQKIYDFIG